MKVNDNWNIEVKDINYNNNLDTINIVIDSISSIVINNKTLKVLHVTYNVLSEKHPYSYNSKIIEKIGDVLYLFNFYPYSSIACDGNYADGLRCYNDSQLGNYSTGIVNSCTYKYKWTGINKVGEKISIHVFPNPTDGFIEVNSNVNNNMTAEVIDFTGRLISTQSFYQNTQFDLTNYSNGVYLLIIRQENSIIGITKIMKK